MTTDAKIGLLLALVFIVAITFVINGLPDFLNKKDKTDETANYINHYNKADEPGIVDKSSREVAEALNKKIVSFPTPSVAEVNAQISQQGSAAYQTILPAASEVVKSTVNTPPVQTAIIETPAAVTALVQNKTSIDASKTIYEVKDGDSLAGISVKYYGAAAGKKNANIRKIFEANKDKLKTMDDLQVGQKLVIPQIEPPKEQELVNTGMFEKVNKETKSASIKTDKETKAAAAKISIVKETKPARTYQQYIVKDQDTLWKIATKYLGDGNRFEEIITLNSSIDPDNLVVGTKIKLPAK